MTILGVKADSVECDGGWRGYYRIRVSKEETVEKTIDHIRKSSYDAWSDAVYELKRWSKEHDTSLILDYYQL